MNTLSIDAAEWRVLLSANIASVNEFISQHGKLSVENLKALHEHMDRAKIIAASWAAASQDAETPQAVAEPIAAPAEVQANGSAPKKRGGWPKGRSRKQPQQVVQ